MVGVIGLTENGQLLDKYLTEHPSPRIVKLIQKVTKNTASVRKTSLPPANKKFMLSLLKDHYLNRLFYEFEHLDIKPYSLIQKYVCEITNYNFAPTTKTQKSIMRKTIIQ